MTELNLHEGDVIEICTEKYGDIKPYIIAEIKSTDRDNVDEPRIRNSNYLLLREINHEDKLVETVEEHGCIVWALQHFSDVGREK